MTPSRAKLRKAPRGDALALSEGTDTPEARARLAELTDRVRREIPSPPETIEERRALDMAVREADVAVQEQLEAASPEEIARLESMVRAHRSGDGAK